MERDSMMWQTISESLAFCGNSLLSPMSMTGDAGLSPDFWTAFPTFDDRRVADAVEACCAYAVLQQDGRDDAIAANSDAVRAVSVEFARLFVGPPRPAAAPWESMYNEDGVRSNVGFGRATIEMKRLLAHDGLAVSNENNQYADHMGIELLYASVLCERIGKAMGELSAIQEGGELSALPETAEECDSEPVCDIALRLDNFIGDHPLGWIAYLRKSAQEAAPDGYYVGILALAEALLELTADFARAIEC